jgi:hypothetical protein
MCGQARDIVVKVAAVVCAGVRVVQNERWREIDVISKMSVIVMRFE